jgi:hypothetical protein
VKLLLVENCCVNLESGVNSQAALKQNYATEVAQLLALPVYKNMALPVHDQLIRVNPVASALGVDETWRLLATTFDVT